jgi:hypothetical protein
MTELENAIESKCAELNKETMAKYPHLAHMCAISDKK